MDATLYGAGMIYMQIPITNGTCPSANQRPTSKFMQRENNI